MLRNVNWAAWLAKAGLDAKDFVTVAFEEEEHVLHAAIAGRGVALASSVLAADFVDRDLLVPLRGDITLSGASYVALCLPERRAEDGIDTFLGWIAPAP